MSESPSIWTRVGLHLLPFADAASADLPLGRLLRLALFQVSVGMATVLLNGTLNRVMIVEIGVPTWLVALLIAIPLLIAPFRALIGHKSDTHKSYLGWRRVPFIWFGTLLQFGGLAIMPFALLLMGRPDAFEVGVSAAALAFLLTGAGLHVTQTAGLALATDIAPEADRPKVVALLYVMLLVGMMASALVIGGLLIDFSPTRLVQVVQGAAALTLVANVIALWKQERRNAQATSHARETASFSEVWNAFVARGQTSRLLVAIGIGAAAFAMQDALLEPYGGEILGLAVGETTALTGLWALGALIGFAVSARGLARGNDPLRLAGLGLTIGMLAFLLVVFAAPMALAALLYLGAVMIGVGLGLFSVGTLIAAMSLAEDGASGMAIGAWGAVQASAAGLGIALGGAMRDGFAALGQAEMLGATLASRATGYGAVYCIEIALLVAALIALGPLVGRVSLPASAHLREFPT